MGGFVVWWRTLLILVPGVSGIEVEIDEIEKGVDMISARLHGLPEWLIVPGPLIDPLADYLNFRA